MEVREKIIFGAEKLFLAYGFRSITMDEIAKELSVSKKTIYQYFRDKNELVKEVVSHFLDINRKVACSIHENATDSIEELVLTSRHMIKNMSTVNPVALMDLQKFHQEAWKVFVAFKQEVFMTLIRESLKKGIRNGFFRKEIDIEVMARMRFEQIQLAFNQDVFPVSEFNFAEVQKQLIEHFVRGILTERGVKKYDEYQKSLTDT